MINVPNHCSREKYTNLDNNINAEDVVIVNRNTMRVHEVVDSRKNPPTPDYLGEDMVPYTLGTFNSIFKRVFATGD